MVLYEFFYVAKERIATWYTYTLRAFGYSRFPYGKQVLIALLIIVLLLKGFFGYRWYQRYQNRSAQYDFGVLLDHYTQEQSNQKPDFMAIAGKAEKGYQKHRRSAVAPFFIALQTDALLKDNQKEEALQVMDAHAPQISEHTPIASLFHIKHALLLLDSADEANRQKGLDQLQALARDTNNVFRDNALYQLFTYYWVNGKVQEAKLSGQELVDAYGQDMRASSPWVALVAEQLETLNA
ncbi:MAG TPA: hypothetical protein VGW78_03610 [Candidatus Babeliales bacterium]|jgi:predicted negative regulator of RcsB-dependent stress response|nr:hypothetical protein [Candidatus Babeliales bacterium]